MDKDDAFLKELQVNDKVKVTVNFFGQEMPFEGTCTGITDDKLSILTNAKPEPIELPLSAIIEGMITSENKINIEESANNNTYDNIEIKHPDVVYGYYIIDLKNENKSNIISNTPQIVDKTDITTASMLLLKEFSKNTIIEDYYNNNVYNLNNISTFSTFYNTNKGENKNTNELYREYMDSYDIYIKTKEFDHHNPGFHTLKLYLLNLVSLNENLHYVYLYDNEDLADFKKEYLDTVEGQHVITVSSIFNTELQNQSQTNNIKLYTDFLFKYLISLKFIFKINIFQAIDYDQDNPNEDPFIKYMITLIPLFAKLGYRESDLTKSIDNWLNEEIKKHAFFSPGISQDKTRLIIHFDKPALVPLISINNSLCQSTKHTLINLLYHLYLSEGRLLYIKVANNQLRKNLTEYIKIKYNLDNDLNLSVKTIFNNFTKFIDSFFGNLIKICKDFVNIKLSDKDSKESYSTINQNTISIIKSLENEADKYITVTAKFNNGLKLFFQRLAAITCPANKINFSEAEFYLLTDYQNCSDFVKESEQEIFSDIIVYFLDLINDLSHSKKITSNFYSKFITVINISVTKQAISFNTKLNRIFIPIEISSSKHGQTSVILKICTQSSLSDKINENVQSNVKLQADNHLFYLTEISCSDFDSVLKNGFNIDITLQYKIKISWDFDKCEPTWETREITETFFIHDELKQLTEFHEIRNLFRDYSSGSVIKDDRMFFGRDQDIRHVIENIRDESGRIVTNRCVCIYGQTRTGKSSLLYHIKKGLRSSPSNIIVDIGDIGSAGASEAGIKYRILSCLLEEIELEHEDIFLLLTDSGISITADPERNKTDESYFTEQIGKIRSILKRKAKDTQIIILIDEFTYVYDWIKEKKLSENFMKFWKAFITNYDICAIIVGQDHMMKFINDQRFTNAFGAIRTWEVNYLKEPDACKLVTMPVSDSPDYAGQYGCTILAEAVNLLVEMTSGSAYLLMNICADFIDYLNERHALTATGGHAEDFLRRNLSKFEERWFEPLFNDKSELDSDASITANKELLKKLALSYSDHTGTLEDELSLSEEEKEILPNLEARRVVEMKDGRWRITVRLYAEWLRNKFGSR